MNALCLVVVDTDIFIHSFIPEIYIAPIQETYSEALSVQLRSKRNVLRSLQKGRAPINRNRNRKLQTSKAPLKSQAQGTSLFTSAASNQRGVVEERLDSMMQNGEGFKLII